MLQALTMESIPKLDEGRLAEAFNSCLRTLFSDLEDRAGVDKVRKISLTFSLKPVMVSNELSEVMVTAEISSNMPKVGSPRPTAMKPRKTKDGLILCFNDESPDSPDQMTIRDITK